MVKADFDFSVYGTNWIGADWDGNIQNIRSGSKQSDRHRCPQCNASPTRLCYKRFHMGYCLAIIEVDGLPAICGERMTIRSIGGCGTHKFNHGHNHVLQQAARGIDEEQPKKPGELTELMKAGRAKFIDGIFIMVEEDGGENSEHEFQDIKEARMCEMTWQEIQKLKEQESKKQEFAAKDARKVKATARQPQTLQDAQRVKSKKLSLALVWKRTRGGKSKKK
jgi:hypothetical protein